MYVYIYEEDACAIWGGGDLVIDMDAKRLPGITVVATLQLPVSERTFIRMAPVPATSYIWFLLLTYDIGITAIATPQLPVSQKTFIRVPPPCLPRLTTEWGTEWGAEWGEWARVTNAMRLGFGV